MTIEIEVSVWSDGDCSEDLDTSDCESLSDSEESDCEHALVLQYKVDEIQNLFQTMKVEKEELAARFKKTEAEREYLEARNADLRSKLTSSAHTQQTEPVERVLRKRFKRAPPRDESIPVVLQEPLPVSPPSSSGSDDDLETDPCRNLSFCDSLKSDRMIHRPDACIDLDADLLYRGFPVHQDLPTQQSEMAYHDLSQHYLPDALGDLEISNLELLSLESEMLSLDGLKTKRNIRPEVVVYQKPAEEVVDRAWILEMDSLVTGVTELFDVVKSCVTRKPAAPAVCDIEARAEQQVDGVEKSAEVQGAEKAAGGGVEESALNEFHYLTFDGLQSLKTDNNVGEYEYYSRPSSDKSSIPSQPLVTDGPAADVFARLEHLERQQARLSQQLAETLVVVEQLNAKNQVLEKAAVSDRAEIVELRNIVKELKL